MVWASFVFGTMFVFLMGIAFRYRTIGAAVLMAGSMMLAYGFTRRYGFPAEAQLPFAFTCAMVGVAVLRQHIIDIRASRPVQAKPADVQPDLLPLAKP